MLLDPKPSLHLICGMKGVWKRKGVKRSQMEGMQVSSGNSFFHTKVECLFLIALQEFATLVKTK